MYIGAVPKKEAPRATKKPSTPASKKPATKPVSKKPAAKPVSKKPATKKPATKKHDHAHAPEIRIGVTPPELSEAAAAAFDEAARAPGTRPPPQKLAVAPWFTQGKAYTVGYHLLTHGLSDAGHPELELANVPGAFVDSAVDLLHHLASYVLEGHRFAHGEVVKVADEPTLGVVSFHEIAPGKGGTDHEVPVLRLVFVRLSDAQKACTVRLPMTTRDRLPEKPKPYADILKEMETFREGDADWKGGKVWSLVYHAGDDFSDYLKKAHNMFFSENALNPMAFKSLRRMESEVVRMTATMLNGGPDACGTMTTGGTESILMAVKAYRERGRKKGIKHPEMVMPESAHVAFEKAAHYFQVKLRKAPLRRDFRVDVDAMKRLVNRNTVMLVGSAPQYPQGVIDPIEEIAEIALAKGIPLHVDSCIGGFVLPFIERLGRKVRPWDFRVKGVTSISADVHKYGFSPKGASVVVYRSMDYLTHQFFISTDWSGGVYASATMPGTRPGGCISAAWAAMVGMGEAGYLEHTKRTLEAHDALKKGIGEIDGITVLGEPESTLLAWASKKWDTSKPTLDVYAVAEHMSEKGWTVDRQQHPASVHVTVTSNHGKAVPAYLKDLADSVDHVRKHPEKSSEGAAAMYGLMAKVPVRAFVRQGVEKVMQSLYAPQPKFEPDPEDTHILPPRFQKYEPFVVRAIDTVYDWQTRLKRKPRG